MTEWMQSKPNFLVCKRAKLFAVSIFKLGINF